MKPTPKPRLRLPFAAAGLLAALGTQALLAQTNESSQESTDYTWSAMLVEIDESAEAATVRQRIVEHAEIEDLAELSAGDRATLTWSGFNWASGIRGLEAGDEGPFGRFMLPVEFVSTELDGQYLNFRVPVPGESIADIESLSSGDWVTFTSPHEPAGWEEAVADVRPYSDVES